MDGTRFDELTKVFADRTSRRRLLRVATGAVLALVGVTRGTGDADAAPNWCLQDIGKRCGGKRGNCRGACLTCQSGVCTTLFCQDRPTPDLLKDGEISRFKPCKVCETGATKKKDAGFVNAENGFGCPIPSGSGGPCKGFGASCQDGQCVRDAVEDGTPCGEPGECQTGICQAGECVYVAGPDGVACTAADRCNEGVCSGGTCVQQPVRDGTVCDFGGQICCQGTCCGGGETCGSRGCQPRPTPPPSDICTIDGVQYVRDDINPDNECEVCNPDISNVAWSASEGGFCNVEAVCCAGICCDLGLFCVNGICSDTTLQCRIGNASYDDGSLNPVNPCQYCDATNNPSLWTDFPDGQSTICPGGGQCCAGACCPAGEVCQAGACTANPVQTCTIGGIEYFRLQRNPADECQQCDPFVNPTVWSLVPQGTSCGTTAGRVCCSGSCCAPNAGCNANGFCA